MQTAEAAIESISTQLEVVRADLDNEKEHRAELHHENAKVRASNACPSTSRQSADNRSRCQLTESLSVVNVALEETKDSLLQKTLQCDEKEAQLKTSHEKIVDLEDKLER